MNKDYYKILDVTYAATEKEIKKAYRQLALKFHPDRNEGNQLAEHHFKEVQEAYEVLSHPGRRSAYNQHRWYRQSNYTPPANRVITPYEILSKCRELNRYMSTLNSHHINQRALYNFIMQILSKDNLQILLKENDESINELIVTEIIKSIDPLPLQSIENVGQILIKLTNNNNAESIDTINKYLKDKKLSGYWSKYMPLAVLIISLLLCLLIYYVSNNHR